MSTDVVVPVAFGVGFVLGVVVAAGYDLAVRRIPNWLNVSLLVMGLAWRLSAGGIAPAGWGVLGAFVGLAILFVPFSLGWFGAGDVKLVTAMGAWLGPTDILWAGLYGVAAGGVLAILVALMGGRAFRREVMGNLSWFALTRRAPAVAGRPRSRQVPLAVALGGAGLAVFVMSGGLSYG